MNSVLPLPRKLLLCAGIVAVVMVPVGLLLTAFGIVVLKISGGAAHDTSLVTLAAAVAVTDLWGGAVVASLTGVDTQRTTAAWSLARAVVISAVVAFTSLSIFFGVAQLVLAVVASNVGSRVGHKQAQLRQRELRRSSARVPAA